MAKVTDEELNEAAKKLIIRLDKLFDGNQKKAIRNAYVRGFKDGYEMGIEQAGKELLAR